MSVIDKLENNHGYYNLPSDYLDDLFNLMKNMTTYLKKYNISYFADGGTSLGLIREHGQILHDNDIDLGMLQSDYDYFTSRLKDVSDTFNYIVEEHNGLIKIFSKDGVLTDFNGSKISPCLDVFLYVKRDVSSISTKGQKNLTVITPFLPSWKNCYYTPKELKPLIKRKYFHHIDKSKFIEVYSPNNPIPYFERYYGKDWQTPIYDKKLYL